MGGREREALASRTLNRGSEGMQGDRPVDSPRLAADPWWTWPLFVSSDELGLMENVCSCEMPFFFFSTLIGLRGRCLGPGAEGRPRGKGEQHCHFSYVEGDLGVCAR